MPSDKELITISENELIENFLEEKTFICSMLKGSNGRISSHMCSILAAKAFQRYLYGKHIVKKNRNKKKECENTIVAQAKMDIASAKTCMACPRYTEPIEKYRDLVDTQKTKKPKLGRWNVNGKKSSISAAPSIKDLVPSLYHTLKKLDASDGAQTRTDEPNRK